MIVTEEIQRFLNTFQKIAEIPQKVQIKKFRIIFKTQRFLKGSMELIEEHVDISFGRNDIFHVHVYCSNVFHIQLTYGIFHFYGLYNFTPTIFLLRAPPIIYPYKCLSTCRYASSFNYSIPVKADYL